MDEEAEALASGAENQKGVERLTKLIARVEADGLPPEVATYLPTYLTPV